MFFISFIEGKPLINGNSKFVCFKTHFLVENDNTMVVGTGTERYYCGEEIDSIHRGRMVFISFMGGKPLINGNPQFVWFKTNFFISFIQGKALINGNPKFVWFKTHFLGRER